jgi:hypothetical protein
MNELLEALRMGNAYWINYYALEILVTKNGVLNKAAVQQFERYANCRVTEWNDTTFRRRPYLASIKYGNAEYGFG